MRGFGLISEGPTDQIVLRNIFGGLFNNKKIPSQNLLPEWDNEDADSLKASLRSNNNAVFDFCKTARFRGFLENSDDFVVIQIDTDALKATEIKREYRVALNGLTIEECIETVKNKFIEHIGFTFYEEYHSRIIFAISVDALECWLLPIFFENAKAKAAKSEGCLKTLNEGISKADLGFTIHKKELSYYREISKQFQKHKDFMRWYILNPSLKIFIEDLQLKTTFLDFNTE